MQRVRITKLLTDNSHKDVYNAMRNEVLLTSAFYTDSVLATAGVTVDQERIRWEPLIKELENKLHIKLQKFWGPSHIRRRNREERAMVAAHNAGAMQIGHPSRDKIVQLKLVIGYTSAGNIQRGMIIEEGIKLRRNRGNGLLRSASDMEQRLETARNIVQLPASKAG